MARVSLKNTFLTVEEDEVDEDEGETDALRLINPRQAASPRSRSVESPPRIPEDDNEQIEKLNKLLGTHLLPSSASSLKGSGAGSPVLRPGSPPPTGSGNSSQLGQAAQELMQLQKRLEEVCNPRGRSGSGHSQVRKVVSDGALNTMVSEHNDLEDRIPQARLHSPLHQVWSSNSVSTMGSVDPACDPSDGG
eukprot:CAMPEP_0115763034 /NCGR_PEP_ID=MMETSP0272-20121206/101333_1 /TAXON_ID=71861 /ORGANISM="Scrippsiella trochoidea, Strain CCMP3099" /LENGTH=191 /DNA_ID=CAMNT_0003208771 /DNA_START=122 /DNA_END=693 /DNA_ORIENTATION=+